MPSILRILLVGFALILLIITLNYVSKNKMPVKYSLFWVFTSILIIIVGIFPVFSSWMTELIGFQTTSNLVIGIILALLLIITMILTVIVSGQNKKIKLLIQEVSILRVNKNEKTK